MYCGDETGSFIGEVGSHSCRFGYGGEDNPKLVLPSYVVNHESTKTKTMACSAVSTRMAQQEKMERILRHPNHESVSLSASSASSSSSSLPLTDPNAFLRQGDIVENWDNLQTAWEMGMDVLRARDTRKHTTGGTPFGKSGTADGKCVHPILAITPGFTQYDGYGASYCEAVKRQQYMQYTELLMEQMEASSVFLAPAPMLAAFSVGRQTAMVVDIGAGGSRITPVVDGLLLEQSQRRSGRGGDWLGHVAYKALLDEKLTVQPRYLLRDKTVKEAKSRLFHNWALQELMYELRTEPFVKIEAKPTQTPRVPFMKDDNKSGDGSDDQEMKDEDQGSSHPDPHNDPSQPLEYEFPDGTILDLVNTSIGKDMTTIPELFFAKKLPFTDSRTSRDSTSDVSTIQSHRLATLTDAPLHELIQQSLLSVSDVDIRKELSSNIVLTGGSSLFPNLDARLSYELSQLLPALAKPKVIAPKFSVERSCASWIGASILTSLGSFQQLWLSRAEYEEYGANLSIQRFA